MIPGEVRLKAGSFYNNRSIQGIFTFLESRDQGENIVYNQAVLISTGASQTRSMRDGYVSRFSLGQKKVNNKLFLKLCHRDFCKRFSEMFDLLENRQVDTHPANWPRHLYKSNTDHQSGKFYIRDEK